MNDETWSEHASFIDAQRAEFDHDELRAERAMADDLAAVLSRVVVGWEHIIGQDLAQYPDVQRVMARYREARK